MRITRTFSREDRLPNGRLMGVLSSDAFSDDGGQTWHWVSNPRSFIPVEVCGEYGIPCDLSVQAAAREAEIDAFVAEYRRQDAEPDAEQLCEMRAAFGPGATVVNVITGRKTKL